MNQELEQEEKLEETEIAIRMGHEEPAFCLENNMQLCENSFLGKAALQVGAVLLVKDAP